MWGIRAVRAVWLAAVVLAAVGGGGCRHGDSGVVDEKRMKELLYQSETHGPPGAAQPGDKNKAPAENGAPQRGGARLTPERIHGGII